MNQYFNPYNYQNNIDRINNQIGELENMKKQLQNSINQFQTPANLTQNFQLAPTRENMKYANSIDDVQKDVITGDTPYFSRDLSILWIKNIKGEIRTFELNEIVPRDEKDLQIELLQTQIDELRKGMVNNEQYFANDIEEQNATDTTESNATTRTTTKSTKSSGVSKVSRSKKE